jgi:small subunit ribosomal protein S19
VTRSVWKGPFVDGYLLKKAETVRSSGRNEIIRIWSRRSTILPQFVGLTFGVYNGHKHVPVNITEDMIGHKFGEFAPTRTFHGHSGDKKAVRSKPAPSAYGETGSEANDDGQSKARPGAPRERGQGGGQEP